ncbi:MAG: hypothetical protein JWL85_291 [Candidatus Saccharibacteria bacterium]|nr:hypothetical protein [Candidatus Saccharibacteria bacterium]
MAGRRLAVGLGVALVVGASGCSGEAKHGETTAPLHESSPNIIGRLVCSPGYAGWGSLEGVLFIRTKESIARQLQVSHEELFDHGRVGPAVCERPVDMHEIDSLHIAVNGVSNNCVVMKIGPSEVVRPGKPPSSSVVQALCIPDSEVSL